MTPVPAEVRRRRRHLEARRTILAAAESLLEHEGIGRFTMRRLAARSGYTPPSIYHYFGDKHALLTALFDDAHRGLLQRFDEIDRNATAADPLDRLRAYLDAVVRFGLDHPPLYRAMEAARPEGAEPLAADEEVRERIQAPLVALHAGDRLLGRSFEDVQQVLWALLHGLVSLPTTRPDIAWTPDLARLAFDAMLGGLVAAPRPAAGARSSR